MRVGAFPVRLRDSVGIHSSLRNHHNLLCPHPAAPEADHVPEEDPQREAHPGHRGDVRRLLAAVPHHQHDTGEWLHRITWKSASEAGLRAVDWTPCLVWFQVAAMWYPEDSKTREKWVFVYSLLKTELQTDTKEANNSIRYQSVYLSVYLQTGLHHEDESGHHLSAGLHQQLCQPRPLHLRWEVLHQEERLHLHGEALRGRDVGNQGDSGRG